MGGVTLRRPDFPVVRFHRGHLAGVCVDENSPAIPPKCGVETNRPPCCLAVFARER